MLTFDLDEVVLETEFDNDSALRFYQKLGFIREKRLYRFYLNGKDAFRLVLPLANDVRTGLPSIASAKGLGWIAA